MKGRRIIWLYPKLEKWMGGTRYVFECCRLLNRQFDLTVVCQKATRQVLDEFDRENINYVHLNSHSFSDLRFWFFHRYSLAADQKQLDNIISHNAIMISGMYPMNLLASRYSNKHLQIVYEPFAFFYDHHYLRSFGWSAYIFFRIVARLFSAGDRKATRKSDAVLVLSEFEARQVRNIYKVDASVVYEGVDVSFFYPRNSAAYETEYGDCFPIMHSTGFDSYKGTDLLMRSLPELRSVIPNFKLLITYTRENKERLNTYKTFLRREHLSGHVQFIGFLPYEELPVLYSYAKFYVEVGKNRSMSLSNKEALACGTPVIRGNDSVEEVVDGYNGFLVHPESTLELVQAINTYFTDPEKYRYVKSNTVKSISENFTWEAVVEKIKSHF